MSPVLISVVIPVKNGSFWLENTLTKIYAQKIKGAIEVIIIDSGSTDTTEEILKKFPVKYLSIPASNFNHGETRNYGVQFCSGEFVVMTVQDAEPVDEYWLQHLLDGFVDETVAGVCGQQIVPHDRDKNPVEWFKPRDLPKLTKYQLNKGEEFEKLSPEKKLQLCSWDNVTACYRKNLLLEIPFQKTSFAEDALWAKDALEQGYSIVYNNKARVYHYHHEDPDFAFRRSLTVFFHRHKFFGHIPKPVQPSIKKRLQLLKVLFNHNDSVSNKVKWWNYNVNNERAYSKATNMFLEALKQGEPFLQTLHQQYCEKPPMNKKPKTEITT